MRNDFKNINLPELSEYYINSEGVIKNKHGKILRTFDINTGGYIRWCNRNNKIFKRYFIHRLIALTFIPNLEEKLVVNHIDGNKKNNDISNLEWCTHKENTQHAIRLGLIHHNINGLIKHRNEHKK